MSTDNKVLDKGGAVREGEELDTKAVSEWLRSQGVDVVGEQTDDAGAANRGDLHTADPGQARA